jgi:hypothetical protein
MIGIAARAGIALGLNFRRTNNKLDSASNEARMRLWWSVFYLEHLLSVMTGRISCLGDGSCSAPLPLPFDTIEGNVLIGYSSRQIPYSADGLWMNQQPERTENRPAWLKDMPLSESLYFFYLVDIALITHRITNKVYSTDVASRGWAHIKDHVSLYNKKLEQWLSDLPSSLAFDGSRMNHSPYQISLALHYYSACIVINRPCLTRPETDEKTGIQIPRSMFGNETAMQCLHASLALLEVIPDHPDTQWAYNIAPSWALLHFMMQATVVLLLHLSIGVVPVCTETAAMDGPGEDFAVIAAVKKALRWLEILGEDEQSSRRAFEFCSRCFNRISGSQGPNIYPSS